MNGEDLKSKESAFLLLLLLCVKYPDNIHNFISYVHLTNVLGFVQHLQVIGNRKKEMIITSIFTTRNFFNLLNETRCVVQSPS